MQRRLLPLSRLLVRTPPVLLRQSLVTSLSPHWHRVMSSATQGSGAGSGEGGKAGGGAEGGAGGGAEGGSGEGGGGAGFDEPLVARVSRAIWKAIKVALGTAVFGGVLYCGYSIVLVLLPVGSSSNRIMRKASDILENDPEITKYFGSVKTFGIDLGGRNEGRRYFVPEYKYDDVLTGVGYHRVKFSLEGDRSKKATVWAEVCSSSGEFRYLIVMTRDGSKVISIVDRRTPDLSKEERQARVSSLLQDSGWVFMFDNDVDGAEQGHALGDYWLKVKTVRDPARLASEGVVGCGWVTETGEVFKGVKDFETLEKMVQRLARGEKPSIFSTATVQVKKALGMA